MIDFQKDVLDRSKDRVIIVDFGAAWCGPCKMIKPVLKDAIKGKNVSLTFIDVDDEPILAQKYNVRSVPHIMAFHQGKVVSKWDRTIGIPGWVDTLLS